VGGAYALVSHLIALGHHRIALIRGAEGNGDAAQRQEGYRAALADHGIEAEQALEVAGDFTQSSGDQAMREILRLDRLPTAVFASNDAMAIGALSALREAGLEVPGKMSVAGFDDIPIARYLSPPLSSVHVDIHGLGVRAMSRLLARVLAKGKPEEERPQHETLPVRVVVRASTGESSDR
jgi:LacI family transcriptional regulator